MKDQNFLKHNLTIHLNPLSIIKRFSNILILSFLV
ncbi:hypothetical protein SLEP1_g49405 [Rubroshorea leprosula]|uniref:Uncharacterized protein n=1 Tax=Rubroshorea leprosula TaxID=152421 RepID=A0AAV5LXN6_9ROSI|nr:hypothetical protein SLEP1_g49405 [Rubroshorea leprosula]